LNKEGDVPRQRGTVWGWAEGLVGKAGAGPRESGRGYKLVDGVNGLVEEPTQSKCKGGPTGWDSGWAIQGPGIGQEAD
jgi:hypothetical protein